MNYSDGDKFYLQQKQIDSQTLRQNQDFVSCNHSFGMLLSSMESLLILSGYTIKPQFNYYNYFDNRNWKTKDQIKSQLYTDLMAYKISKLAYIQKYGKFDFPDFPSIEKIIIIILKWTELANDNELKNLCSEILELIYDQNPKPISYYQSRIEKSSFSNSETYPISQFELSNRVHDRLDKRDEKVIEELLQNQDAKFGLYMDEELPNTEYNNIIPKKEGPLLSQEELKIQKIMEQKINKNFLDLKNGLENYFNKIPSNKELEGLFEVFQNDLKNYYQKYNQIDFLFNSYNIDSIKNQFESYCEKSYNEEKKIKEFLNKIFNFIYMFKNL